MELVPAIPPGNRSIGEATEADVKLGLQNIAETVQWPFFQQEFYISHVAMTIGRVEGLGAGTLQVAWCLKYNNIFSMLRDWHEIKSVPESLTERRIRR